MLKNFVKITLRSLWRNKIFTMINLISLSIGISASFVIYQIVSFDLTFNQFGDSDKIFRVVTDYSLNGEANSSGAVPGALPEIAQSELVGIRQSAPFYTLGHLDVTIPKGQLPASKFRDQNNIIYADSRYFKLFNYKWLTGSPETSLNNHNQVVLSDARARVYFPNISYDKIIGKTVVYDTIKATVTGIVEDMKGNTDFKFQDFISYQSFTTNKRLKHILSDWIVNGMVPNNQYFLKLTPNTSPNIIEKQLNKILKNNTEASLVKGDFQTLRLQQLNDLHFNERYGNFYGTRTANKTTLYGLLIIAALILLLGCINFINLATANSSKRKKEIAIRKIVGSGRRQLIFQFLFETYFITLIAILISIGLTPILLKLISEFLPIDFNSNLFTPSVLLFLLLLTLLVGFISGLYPAFLLSGYKPLLVLKNQANFKNTQNSNVLLRKSLTVSQFIIAQFFIMATVLVGKQIYYALHKNLGFKKDAIIIINTPRKNREMKRQYLFRDKILSTPGVELVSVGLDAPSSDNANVSKVTYKNGSTETEIVKKYGDPDYIKLYKINLLAGRNLLPSDTGKAVLINESCAKALQFLQPELAIGKNVNCDGENLLIVGVLADFHQASLHSPIKPLAILSQNGQFFNGVFHVALKPQRINGSWKNTIASIGKLWNQLYPNDDFEYKFFDENIEKFYENEQKTSDLLTWATALSVLISVLGLIGLTIYSTNQRIKEVGIRKVVGATVFQLVALLEVEIVRLILLAFVLTSPIAWIFMNKWLQDYADRTTISWWIFIGTGAGMLLIALIASGFQTMRVALANPVVSLKSE